MTNFGYENAHRYTVAYVLENRFFQWQHYSNLDQEFRFQWKQQIKIILFISICTCEFLRAHIFVIKSTYNVHNYIQQDYIENKLKIVITVSKIIININNTVYVIFKHIWSRYMRLQTYILTTNTITSIDNRGIISERDGERQARGRRASYEISSPARHTSISYSL